LTRTQALGFLGEAMSTLDRTRRRWSSGGRVRDRKLQPKQGNETKLPPSAGIGFTDEHIPDAAFDRMVRDPILTQFGIPPELKMPHHSVA